jgi:hypothetical protein
MSTFELSTNLFPIVNIGMYTNQTCDSDLLIDTYAIDNDFNEGLISYDADTFWNNFDNTKFKAVILERATDFITDNVKPLLVDLGLGIIDIKVVGMYSPKYYNFESDSLNFDLVTDDKFTDNIIDVINFLEPNELADLSKFLKDNYTSYDGFTSFTDNNVDDLIESIKDGQEREIGAFLTWYWSWTDSSYECGNWECYLNEDFPMYDEFLTDDFIKECNEIRDYIVEYTKDNYSRLSKTEMIDAICEHFIDYDDIVYSSIENCVSDTIRMIESNTLELDL